MQAAGDGDGDINDLLQCWTLHATTPTCLLRWGHWCNSGNMCIGVTNCSFDCIWDRRNSYLVLYICSKSVARNKFICPREEIIDVVFRGSHIIQLLSTYSFVSGDLYSSKPFVIKCFIQAYMPICFGKKIHPPIIPTPSIPSISSLLFPHNSMCFPSLSFYLSFSQFNMYWVHLYTWMWPIYEHG